MQCKCSVTNIIRHFAFYLDVTKYIKQSGFLFKLSTLIQLSILTSINYKVID